MAFNILIIMLESTIKKNTSANKYEVKILNQLINNRCLQFDYLCTCSSSIPNFCAAFSTAVFVKDTLIDSMQTLSENFL